MSRLLLIDGYSELYRAFYAIRNLSAPDGTPTGAVFGFLRLLHKMLGILEPTHVAVAFDVKGPSFRKELYADYKANRKPMPDELRAQVPLVREALEHLGIRIVELAGFEADDVLATLATRGVEAGLDSVIATADKDLMQLVDSDKGLKMWHTRRESLLDEAGVEEIFGVRPTQVAAVLALMGDSSDNVPGCPGIGEKGAKKLLGEWGTIEAIYEHLDEIKPTRAKNALEAGRDMVELSQKLVIIPTDLELGVDPTSLGRNPGDVAALAHLYRRLGLTSLLAELDLSELQSEAVEPEEVEALELAGSFALAIGDEVAAIASDGAVQVSSFDAATIAPGVDAKSVIHGSKDLLRRLRDDDAQWAEQPEDSRLICYMLSAGEPMTLEACARRHLEMLPAVLSISGDDDDLPPRAQAARDALWTEALFAKVWPELEADPGSMKVYREIEQPLVPVLEAMQRRGVAVDIAELEHQAVAVRANLEDIELKIYEHAGLPFNIASPKQLGEVMFDRLGLPVLKRTGKTKKPSTNHEVLVELAHRGYEMPALIIDHRERSKLLGTYLEALPQQVGDDGRIHSRLQQTVAATGRLSSTDPNLQNIPVRTELGRQVRKAFIAAPGHHLVIADYSQIELRVLAHLAEDEAMIEAFHSGEDIHRATAAAVLGKESSAIDGSERRAAKAINFGLMYGKTAFTLAKDLSVSRAEAQDFIDAYFERFAGVRAWLDRTTLEARESGMVTTLYGRTRKLATLNHPNRMVRQAAERMAINAPVQGTAADLIKIAMIRLEEALANHPARMTLQVHDELIFEVPEAEVAETTELVREMMTGVADLLVPLTVDVGSGRSWYDAK